MNNDDIPQISSQVDFSEAIITPGQLRAVGIDLPDEQMQELIIHIQNTVNERIGEEVVESLTDEQLEELIALQGSRGSDDDDRVSAWLRDHVPDYEQIVDDNTAIVIGEVVANADAIQQSGS